MLDPFHLQGPQQAFESINQSIYTMLSGSPKKNTCWYGTQKPLNQNLNIYLYIYQKETAIFLATKHEKTVMACSYLIFLKIFPSFWTCGLQYYKNESIHLNSWPGTIVLRNRKIIWKHRSLLLIFWLELKYLEWLYREYIKTAKNGSFCEDLLGEIDFKAILANFCCYGYGANASEAVQKISTRTLELYANSLKQLIL